MYMGWVERKMKAEGNGKGEGDEDGIGLWVGWPLTSARVLLPSGEGGSVIAQERNRQPARPAALPPNPPMSMRGPRVREGRSPNYNQRSTAHCVRHGLCVYVFQPRIYICRDEEHSQKKVLGVPGPTQRESGQN